SGEYSRLKGCPVSLDHYTKEFTKGQPGSGVDATIITADWLNAIQRELVNLVLAGGMTVVPGDDSQILKAIQAIQNLAVTWEKLSGRPSTVSGFGITDAFTKTETASAIQGAISALVGSSPAALDTLNELAAALGNDPNFATTMTNALANKAAKATTLSGYGIQVATQGEAEAQSDQDNSKPMTALRVWQAIAARVSQATEVAFGWAKIATQNLTDTGVDDKTIVTPKKLRGGFSIMTGPAGYIAFPSWLGGFIFLWNTGVAASAEGSQTITYPVSLTDSVWIHHVSTHIDADNTGANGSYQTVGAPGLSSCRVFMQGMNTMGVAISPKLFLLGK
ncbi:hypothetical protein ACW9HV_30615, partial [Pseudomonas azotoformans]